MRQTATIFISCCLLLVSGCKKDEPEAPVNPSGPGTSNPYGAGKGAISFSRTNSANVGSITISLDGLIIGELTQYWYNPNNLDEVVIPTCGQSSSQAIITLIKPVGTYAWCGIRSDGTTYTGSVTITEGNCTSIGITSTHLGSCGSQPPPNNPGVITFYSQTSSHSPITIKVDGQVVGTLTTYHPNGPTCGSGQVNVPRSAGLHSWSAIAQDGYHYEGSLTWPSSGGCMVQQVESLLSPPATTFTGWTFWCQNDLGHGPISIYVDGIYKGQITQHANGGNGPNCGQGNVNVQMPPGPHTWGGLASDGTYWGTYYGGDFIINPTTIYFDEECHRQLLQ